VIDSLSAGQFFWSFSPEVGSLPPARAQTHTLTPARQFPALAKSRTLLARRFASRKTEIHPGRTDWYDWGRRAPLGVDVFGTTPSFIRA
jgi:hypothetical protein